MSTPNITLVCKLCNILLDVLDKEKKEVPTVICKVFNILHDMETKEIEIMESYAYGLLASKDEKDSSLGRLLQLQCQYVIGLRKSSGDRNNKRPWR